MEKQELIQYVKSEFIDLPMSDLLKKSTDALVGVTVAQTAALKNFKIESLYDLGLSDIFNNASFISSISNTTLKPSEGFLPADMVDQKALLESIVKLKLREPALLTGVGDAGGKMLKKAFNFNTINDLAKWLPYQAARKIVNAHLGIDQKTVQPAPGPKKDDVSEPVKPAEINVKSDPEAPQDLVPKTGEYPVEVVYYDSVVMIDAPKRKDMKEITGRVTLSFDDTKMGYDTPGFGAILTFKQSWTAEGITLGSLIKSIALAPGESTKIAVIDWQRTTTGTTSEVISQKENLRNEQSQSRAISEIAGATANELQSGSSLTGSVSTSANAGVAGATFLGGVLAGGTASTSINGTAASTVTASAGQRDISSNMQQNIDNSTQQNSFAARNKRSSVVTEVSQSETETITTRTITNYNHMHALTIQYWQVVQAFTTEVKVDRYKRCIFIPMDIIDFSNETVISKNKSVLFNSARTEYIKMLLSSAEYNVNVFRMAKEIYESMEIPPLTGQNRAIRDQIIINRNVDKLNRRGHIIAYGVNQGLVTDYNPENGTWKMSSSTCLVNADISLGRGASDTIDKINIVKEDGSIVVISKANFGVNRRGGGLNPGFTEPIPLGTITSINVELKPFATLIAATVSLYLKPSGNINSSLPIGFVIPPNSAKNEILKFQPPAQTNDLANLLNEDALYYSQKIWMNMDPNFLSMQLSPYKIPVGDNSKKKTLNLTEYIDPKPIAVMGNCLAFIWHDQEDADWKKWEMENILSSKNQKPSYQKIALPTDGIFGEAVLGRFNSAEKLDMTRFWNWQDSPIPFSAPDIAAIQAGNHQVEGPQRPGNLDPSLLSIQAPQALPDPTGMQGVLQALAVTNLFRDMSGVAQTSLLAQGALNASSAGATAAGAQAGANMATFANMQVEMAKIVASLAPMLLGLPPLPTPATSTISNSGAALNAAKAVDARQVAESGAGGGISPSQVLSGTSPKSSNEQKVLEKVTGTTPAATISLPSTLNTPSGNARSSVSEQLRDPKTTVPVPSQTPAAPVPVPTTIEGARDILNKAAEKTGSPTAEDLKAIEGFLRNDFEATIKPDILTNKDSFDKLKPALRQFLNWLANIQLLGLDTELQKEVEEGHGVAKNAFLQSLNTATSETIKGNSLDQLKVAMEIISNAQLFGYGDTADFSSDALFAELNLRLELDTIFEPAIVNGEQKRLTVTATLNIAANEGIPLQNCPLTINVTGGTVSPFNTGKTNSVGEFVCSIICTNRAKLAIGVEASDSFKLGLKTTVTVPL